MSAREFVDTNLFVYAHDASAGEKRVTSVDILNRLWSTGTGCASLQVLQEFYLVSTRKAALPPTEAIAQIQRLTPWRIHAPTIADVLEAARNQERHRLSFWDSMIVLSATRLGCSLLWTEDLNHGQVIDGVEIRNPFAEGRL